MKTIKEIADTLGVDKQKVYRFIRKSHISEANQKNGVMYYDEKAQTLIQSHFKKTATSSEVHHEAHQTTSLDTVISMLQTELDTKNKQISEQQQTIRELTAALENTTKSLQAAQALHAGTMQKQLTSATEEPNRPQGLFSRIFKR